MVFWVPPERMDDFGVAYEELVAPVLRKHGLEASAERGRATVDSVFSRLFAFETPADFASGRDDLWYAPAWHDLRQRLGASFCTQPGGLIRCQFVLYRCPAGAGRTVPVGPGTWRQGWLTLSARDGLPASDAPDMLIDPQGHLWRAGYRGVTRFDGERLVTFTTTDGLAGSVAEEMLLDRDGNLWVGTQDIPARAGAGISRYDGETFETFTAADGLAGDVVTCMLQDRNGALWFGFDTGVTRYDGQSFTTFAARDGLPDGGVFSMLEDHEGALWLGLGLRRARTNRTDPRTRGVVRYDGQAFELSTDRVTHVVYSMLEDQNGHLWFGGDGEITRYDGQRSIAYTAGDGLVAGRIIDIVEERDGLLWFGSGGGGVSRFDGQSFAAFTTESGLGSNYVQSMVGDEDGNLWVGVMAGGISRYHGSNTVTFTVADGLPSPTVRSIVQDAAGAMWFGTNGGLARYDGEEWTTFTSRDGLAGDRAEFVVQDKEGNLWIRNWHAQLSRYDGEVFRAFEPDDFGNLGWTNGLMVDQEGDVWIPANPRGVLRFDGQRFSSLTTADGLVSDHVFCLAEDRAGNMWFGTPTGAIKYDGETFSSLTRAQGLGFDFVNTIVEARDGSLWFGSGEGLVSRYDGEEFAAITGEDGLMPAPVNTILEDQKGHFWFGSWGGGILRYDGLVFQDLSHRDGLVADTVNDILQDRDGDYWIATDLEVTRYTPSARPPAIRIREVIADRSYGVIEALALPSSQALVQFAFQGGSFTTTPARMAYVYRLRGHQENLRATRQTEVRYTDLPIGDYVFEVRAVDRDLNYSEPVAVHLTIHTDYEQLTLTTVLCLSLAGLVGAAAYGMRRRRERDQAQQALMHEMEQELEDARRLQMGLMPTTSPDVQGLRISGRCVSANHVGGDFFQYFERDDGITISLADVTGHAMEAAIPAVMFSGILDNQMEQPSPLKELFQSLNHSLCRSLGEHTLVCLSMVDLDLATRMVRLSNCGCPYPLHYRAGTGEITEIQVDAYPLGVREGTEFRAVETSLSEGDYLILHSDGFSEAANAEEQLFGFDGTTEVIRQGCSEGLAPEELIERLIGEVKVFAGDEPQADDMTCVVVKVADEAVPQ